MNWKIYLDEKYIHYQESLTSLSLVWQTTYELRSIEPNGSIWCASYRITSIEYCKPFRNSFSINKRKPTNFTPGLNEENGKEFLDEEKHPLLCVKKEAYLKYNLATM